MNESAIGTGVTSAPPESGATQAGESPTPSQGSGVPEEQSQGSVTAPVQGEQPTQPSQDDPLAGFPPDEELKAAVANKTPYAEQAARIKSAYEPLKTQLSELETKFKVFEPVADRFQTPEELQQAVEWHDKLFAAYERNEKGQLVPATEKVVQDISQRDPLVADYLAADLMNGLTRTDDGREISRFDLALEEIATNPTRKADRLAALKLLGGVEPSSIAPTWQATDEELAVIDDPENPTREGKELQEIYKRLSWDERQDLRPNTPDFIKNYLKKEQFQQNLMRENETAKQLETQRQERAEAYQNQQAEMAGNTAVQEGFKQLFTEYANNVVENSKFIAPLDPNSPEAQAMGPEAVAQFNQKAQQVNTGIGKFIALTTAALSVPDTAWVAQDFLKELGVTDEMFQKFNAARQEYANNTRDHGELNYRAQRNGNGNQTGLGALQTNARSAAARLKGTGNLVSKPIKELFSALFEMKAGNYNATLNGAATVRPPLNGTGFNPTTATTQRPFGTSKDEIYSRGDIERLAR